MATITIPKKLEKELKSASQKLGVSREDLLLNAILYYLQILEKKDTIERGIGGVGENERFWFTEIWEKDMKKGDVCIINLAVGIGHEQ